MVARRSCLLALVLFAAACARESALPFRVDNARAHVERLAGAIGSRPLGSAANAAARAYLIDQLRLYGFEVRVQEVDAVRPEYGLTARVSNIIAIKPGARADALAIVAHYDSVPEGPGAMDDALGTAVALEAGRVLAARATARHSLVILLTDGEEAGLMGAAGAVDDAELRARVRAYVNLESIGASGPSFLFESGPGNETLVRTWARAVPRPRGASYAVEIYKRLPNDTDFTVLKRWNVAGLNFAPVGDSHAYHTSRDTAERLTTGTIRHMGESTVSLVAALDGVDAASGGRDVRFSDVIGRHAIVLSHRQGRLLAIVAVIAGLAAWWRMVRRLFAAGTLHALSTVGWGVSSLAAAVGAMLAAVWLLRLAREVYHPWYAHGGRLLALLVVVGALAPWYVTRLARLLPERWRYVRAPEAVWALILLPWVALVAGLEWAAPAASHVWSIPVLASSLALALAPAGSILWRRAASAVALVVCTVFFLPDGLLLFQFLIAIFGRLPMVTPFWVYPAFVALVGSMIAPPLVATGIGLVRGRARHGIVGSLLLLALAVTAGLAVAADAYTPADPLRRTVRYVSDVIAQVAYWDVSSNEPGLDLDLPGAEAMLWRPVGPGTTPRTSLPVSGGRSGAFTFRRPGEVSPPPAAIAARTTAVAGDGTATPYAELEVAVLPEEDGLAATLVLPAGLTPARSTPIGTTWGDRWRSTFLGVPKGGVSFRVTVPAAAAGRLGEAAVMVTAARLPGAVEGGLLPRFLPRQRAAWTARATWIVHPAPAATVPAAPPALPLATALR